jgi:inosine-uridine nucleoside N-ribohydrolase
MKCRISIALLLSAFLCTHVSAFAQNVAPTSDKVILDTDIGDDIDDAFALGLLLSSPQVDLLGVTTAYGDTHLRARLVKRYLCQVGECNVPVSAGPETKTKSPFTQARWAERYPDKAWPDAISFILDAIRRYPDQITLISIAPFSNVGALIDRDPATFRRLKRVVIMGGSIRRGYGDLGYLPNHGPDPEYNILMDIPSAKKLFNSGVSLYVMPLDSTQLKLDEVKRNILFSQGTRLTDTLTLLYHQWTASTLNPTPTLFDAMAAAYALNPSLCPTQPMHIVVDDKGYTRVQSGAPNAQVCLQSSPDRFFDFYLHRVLNNKLDSAAPDGIGGAPRQ